MNERITQLAVEAGLLNYVDLETPRRYFVSGDAGLEEVEKFAELLIREGAKICKDVGAESKEVLNASEDYQKGREMGTEVCHNMIKKHFGVK